MVAGILSDFEKVDITLTQKAAEKIKALANKQGKKEPALRIQVVGGGCSGLSYQFGFADSISSDDKVFEQFGVKVAVDNKSLFYLSGSELDYEESLLKSGFKVKNPNASVSCSCGESFSV